MLHHARIAMSAGWVAMRCAGSTLHGRLSMRRLIRGLGCRRLLDGQSDWMDDGKLYHDRTHVQERDNAAKRARYQDKKRRNNYAKKIRRIDETTP